jgi:hypothetical protein
MFEWKKNSPTANFSFLFLEKKKNETYSRAVVIYSIAGRD